VIGLLLEGKNQAVIAHVIGVCEGTVSRIRRRAIDRLRALLED
jgi:DNA-directed RNA polymerase specialized sigma subunit